MRVQRLDVCVISNKEFKKGTLVCLVMAWGEKGGQAVTRGVATYAR